MSKIKVAVLGPAGTYTEMVASEYYKNTAKFIYTDIPHIFDLVMNGEVVRGIIPIEDSVEGDVSGTIDLFRTHDIYITRELHLNVVHSLLGKGRIEDLKVIGSHEQALAHCKNFLDTNFPNLERRRTGSTAEAAKMASADPTFGAIANKKAAQIYGLNILRENIHDYGVNETRFFEIASEPIIPDEPSKTSILLYPKEDRPGLLYNVLREFAEQGVNITKIVSRPARGVLGSYVFWLDIEGNKEKNPNVRLALENLKRLEVIEVIRELGAYPYEGDRKRRKEAIRIKPPEKTIITKGGKITIDAHNLEIGPSYPLSYLGKDITIHRPSKGVLRLSELIK